MRIKKFNEDIGNPKGIWMRGGEDDKGNPHCYTDRSTSMMGLRPELDDFFNKFSSNIINIKNDLDKNGYVERHDLNYIEELYSLFGKK